MQIDTIIQDIRSPMQASPGKPFTDIKSGSGAIVGAVVSKNEAEERKDETHTTLNKGNIKEVPIGEEKIEKEILSLDNEADEGESEKLNLLSKGKKGAHIQSSEKDGHRANLTDEPVEKVKVAGKSNCCFSFFGFGL